MVFNQSLKGLFRVVSQRSFTALVCGKWKHYMLIMPKISKKIKKSAVSRSPFQGQCTHSISATLSDLGLNAMSLIRDWHRELLPWDQSPTGEGWTYDTWLIHIPDLYASIWDYPVGSSCNAERENHLLWAHVSETSALNLGQWPLSHTPFTMPPNSKLVRIVRKKIRIMSKIQMRLVQYSLHKPWEVWGKKNKPDLTS